MHKSGYCAVQGVPVSIHGGVSQATWELYDKDGGWISTAVGPMSLLTVTALADHLRRTAGEKIDEPSGMTTYIEGL